MSGVNRVVDIFVPQLPSASATGVLTSDNTNVSDGDTVTIGTQVYTFKTALTSGNANPGEVLISATNADGSLTNLKNAINGTGTPGTDYDSSTPLNTNVSSGAVASHTITVTAKNTGFAGNTVATTETSAHLSWGDTTLDGGSGGALTNIHLDVAQAYTSMPIDVQAHNEIIAFINMKAHAGTNPTLDCKVQYSPDCNPSTGNPGTWVDSGDTFTQMTTSNGLFFKKLSANFGRWIRLVYTLAGTSPDYTLDSYVLGKL